MSTHVQFDTIIIGTGIAGLSVAKGLGNKGNICLISKGQSRDTATHLAQGGIAVALNKVDTTKCHYEDTMNAGAGLCEEEAVKVLVKDGPACVQSLIDLGIHFDREAEGFHFTKEGAHSQRRILHAGDATGREIERVLRLHVNEMSNITLMESTAVIQLLTNKNGACIGCLCVKDEKLLIVYAKAIVLATGGCGQVYSHNTNPPLTTGDGIAMAFQIGADIQDMEFIQFHPTTLYLGDKRPISIFLISEAVRGEGAVLRNIHGERFMLDVHPLSELAPRDIVARAIISEMKRTKSDCVFLDLSGMKVDVQNRFPTIHRRCREAKIDMTRDFIPVVPSAHYLMGGVKVDEWGRSSVVGLYAVGEVSTNGIHGANRLASNSLLDGLVFGHRVAKSIRQDKIFFGQPEDIKVLDYQTVDAETRIQVRASKQVIRDVMWRYVGIIRSNTLFETALKTLTSFSWICDLNTYEPDIVEVQHLLVVAQLITKMAFCRTESRGAHFRLDFPKTDDARWIKHQVINHKNSSKLIMDGIWGTEFKIQKSSVGVGERANSYFKEDSA